MIGGLTPWKLKNWHPATLLLSNGKIPLPSLVMVMRSLPWDRAILFILLRETTQSNSPDSSTNLKKCQKTFSPCQGARFASRNWPTTLVNSWLSDTWNPGRSFLSRGERERGSTGFCSSAVSLFLGWGVLKDLDSGRWTPANSLLPQGYRVAVFFSLGLYFWQKPLYFLAHSSKLSPSLRKAGCHWVKPSSVKRS